MRRSGTPTRYSRSNSLLVDGQLHDPSSLNDRVNDELRQRRESGYDVAEVASRIANTDPEDAHELEQIANSFDGLSRLSTWTYDEPDALDEILASSPGDGVRNHTAQPSRNRFLGSWLGRVAGCNLGKPVEDGTHWTSSHIRRYLELGESYPLTDYIPVLDPMPAEFVLRENWPQTTRGNIHGSARDDDIDYSILNLHLVDQHGGAFDTGHVAQAWLAFLPYSQVYTAERAAYANLVGRVPLDRVGSDRNPYREWIGALIRGDAFGWAHPNNPRQAAEMAYRDAVLSHRGNGIYGEMWSAALVSVALIEREVETVVERSLGVIPARSRLARAIGFVRTLHREGRTWEAALVEVQREFGHYEWVHTVNNAALIAAGLLWGAGDFSTAVGLTVQGGWDTDSNGATVGSVMGALLGADGLPPHFIDPLEDRTRSAVFGYDNSHISDLARRSHALAART